MNKEISSHKIIEFLQAKLLYVKDNGVKSFCNKISNLDDNQEKSICWIKKYNYDISSLKSNIILVTDDFKNNSGNQTIIYTKNPQLAITYIINEFFIKKTINNISKKASIDKTVKLGKNINIEDNVVVGKNCVIGDNTYIYSNCVIYPNTVIGSNVTINAGAKIGQEGFGYIKDLDRKYIQFPHIGRVILNDDVEIGSNTCIDRGALSDTIIGEGSKINNLVHIAHNVKIGKNCLITAQVNISGSSIIEDGVYIGPGVNIIDGTIIGMNAVIGMGAIVRKNVESNKTIVPIESFEKREYIKILKSLRDNEK